MNIKSFKKLRIPEKPGVYLFKSGKEILYIGKATSLRARTRSYFAKDLMETRGSGLVEMLTRAKGLSWQPTESVLEALILEANLIKKFQPKYNSREKDDKSFNYVVITREKLPKIIIVRGKNLINFKGSVFGPFINGGQLKAALKLIRRIFPFLDEKTKNYHEFYKQLNLAPDLENRKMYLQNIRNIRLFFQGKKKKILRGLKKEMKELARSEEFEKAAEIRRQIFALEHINDVALIKEEPKAGALDSLFRIEAYDVAHISGRNMVGVMAVIENGMPAKSEYRKFKVRTQKGANDTGALAEIVDRRLAHQVWRYSNLIVVDGGRAQITAVEKVLGKAGVKIPVLAVVKDKFHRPRQILGDRARARKYEKEIMLANNEAHRFAIAYHKNLRGREFLK
ncbi:MAG: UvrB/UvrC motif-containing protein [Patescibacteria group bacterium]